MPLYDRDDTGRTLGTLVVVLCSNFLYVNTIKLNILKHILIVSTYFLHTNMSVILQHINLSCYLLNHRFFNMGETFVHLVIIPSWMPTLTVISSVS